MLVKPPLTWCPDWLHTMMAAAITDCALPVALAMGSGVAILCLKCVQEIVKLVINAFLQPFGVSATRRPGERRAQRQLEARRPSLGLPRALPGVRNRYRRLSPGGPFEKAGEVASAASAAPTLG